jgi:hypothetical protein
MTIDSGSAGGGWFGLVGVGGESVSARAAAAVTAQMARAAMTRVMCRMIGV